MNARRGVSTQSAYAKGLAAERLAAADLRKRGYRILGRRYRTAEGEVDLVAAAGRHLAFIEVKRRSSHADAAWAISAHQQRRIAHAAETWLQANPAYQDHDITFDAVLISPQGPPEHMQDAFRL